MAHTMIQEWYIGHICSWNWMLIDRTIWRTRIWRTRRPSSTTRGRCTVAAQSKSRFMLVLCSRQIPAKANKPILSYLILLEDSNIFIQTAPTTPSCCRTRRYCPWNTICLKGEWRRQFTSGPWNLRLTETADDTTNLPPVWNNIIKERLTVNGAGTTTGGWGGGGGDPVWGILLLFPFVSTVLKFHHTDKGCSCSWKL